MQRLVSMPVRSWLSVSLLCAASLGAGCFAENDQSVAIINNSLPISGMTGACTPSGPQIVRGMYDIGLGSLLNQGYLMGPKVINQLPPIMMALMQTGMGMEEANDVFITGFDVQLVTDPDQPISSVLPPAAAGLTEFFVAEAVGQLTPGSNAQATVEVFPAAAATLLLNSRQVQPGPASANAPYQTLTARIRARGTHAGDTILSQWFDYPIEICAFCLPVRADQAGVAAYNGAGGLADCPDPALATAIVAPMSCSPAQDGPSSCCTSKSRQVLCGNNIPHKMTTM